LPSQASELMYLYLSSSVLSRDGASKVNGNSADDEESEY
jgi:hypothetical protein